MPYRTFQEVVETTPMVSNEDNYLESSDAERSNIFQP